MPIVKNMIILNALKKAGFITFCKDTGTIVGFLFASKGHKAYYVEGYGPAANFSSFEFHGKYYRIQYFDGCFYPFVVQFEPVHRTFGV